MHDKTIHDMKNTIAIRNNRSFHAVLTRTQRVITLI